MHSHAQAASGSRGPGMGGGRARGPMGGGIGALGWVEVDRCPGMGGGRWGPWDGWR